jgi:NitT/TauT family transport system permease protein
MNQPRILAWQILISVSLMVIWEWGYSLHDRLPWLVPELLDPYFVSKPSAIYDQFLHASCLVDKRGAWNGWNNGQFAKCIAKSENNLWVATLVTLKNTLAGFAIGTSSGFVLGLLLGRSDRLTAIFQPFIVAANSIPRIALAPIIILAFGLGDASKIVTAWLVVVFLVFFNTFEGARSVDRDHISAARLLGATEWQITRTVIIPSTMAWLFASLTPAISFALIGVILGEFIGAQQGIGRMIIEAEARGEAAGMMVAVFVLMIVGVLLAGIVRRVQTYLLRWRPQIATGL